ncbi:bacillithiol biosynthesis cysteine-adding enzyme BshC [Planococcus maritimus]|uniref:bacillithiol biosynthesis cysteine-adding enzyme BshC n=1 Tax=Planococcus maritimus TaxID=192421 RepID=UPI00079B6837|nr:bacillithiol biosynthesis cysteine-adding enzyme BshC [Planococcus maritimus]KYG59055.1 bacillithiol biosynthesis cysteine-adding enzyme BshC [Planococcus maritimus]OED32760.1 bacillithiol biosynthesis cysteine-adding enzyme BshC [Planococcus maritimus]
MKLKEKYIPPSSKLMVDYTNEERQIIQYFSYQPSLAQAHERLETLKGHPVDRKKLASIVSSYMEPFGISDAAKQNLAHFEAGASVVVTGQQAGLLTGPLYTVHKAISAILLAKEAADKLGTPVVPVFWIAGEDHDLAEICHIYRETNGRIEKLNYPHAKLGKSAASHAPLKAEEIEAFLEEYFRSLPETAHTKEIRSIVFSHLEKTDTFTAFFASLLNHFFDHQGLLYIDAADKQLRAYEGRFFSKLIENSGAIAKAVVEAETALEEDGYKAGIDAKEEAAHLFLTIEGERLLLEREGSQFVVKNTSVSFTQQQLLDIAKHEPERLSNNVVTRPLMQDFVFPVLAFVGGPGEIAYWAALKGAFELMDMEMPIVMPRLSVSLIDRRTASLMEKRHLSFEDVVVERKVPQLRNELYEHIRDEETEAKIDEVKKGLTKEYEELISRFTAVSAGLTPLTKKNLQIHLKQLDFLKHKLQDEVAIQNSTQFNQLAAIENALLPESGLQERIYNPVPYLNQYGKGLIEDLLDLPMNYDNTHKIVIL